VAEPDPIGIEAAAKADWMRARSHAPRFVSPEDLERMWLDWRGLEIDSYLELLTEKREEVAAYLSVQEQPDERLHGVLDEALNVLEEEPVTAASVVAQGVIEKGRALLAGLAVRDTEQQEQEG
jgi:hypothetical protein